MTMPPFGGPAPLPGKDLEPATSLPGQADRESIARRVLRWDAAYCVVAGVSIAAFASAIDRQLDVSTWVVATVGVAAVALAGLLGWLARHEMWRRSALVAAAANAAAAAGVGYLAFTRVGSGRYVLAALAAQVAGFAAAQAWTAIET